MQCVTKHLTTDPFIGEIMSEPGGVNLLSGLSWMFTKTKYALEFVTFYITL